MKSDNAGAAVTGRPQYGWDDPIAALATPPGESALAVLRLSGKGSLGLLAKVFSRPEKLAASPGGAVVHGWLLGPGGARVDEVLAAVHRAPGSYTGEDSAEVTCHGGFAVVKAARESLRAAGFRDALPGEFTFRAFMNGKLDLTRAESVRELIAAATDEGRSRALRRLSGALEREINEIKALLTAALAGTELALDYDENEGAPEPEGGLPERPLAEEALKRLQLLAASWRAERLYQEGALAVIAGRPNAGKSSLFNRLVREDRAIVSAAPGTTRDWIEAAIAVEGIPVRLADTAGLREAGAEEAERQGIERSLALAESAALVLYVIDSGAGLTEEDRAFLAGRPEGKTLAVWNKTDLAPQSVPFAPLPDEAAALAGCPALAVSAKTGEGVPALCAAIAGLLERNAGGGASGGADSEGVGIGSQRQGELVGASLAALEEALALADKRASLDLIAPALRDAVNALGEITGEVTTADVLEAMFSKFCVGK
ncbi:MAG: tRNA modification GTPase TrmE [Treponematales bacterium]